MVSVCAGIGSRRRFLPSRLAWAAVLGAALMCAECRVAVWSQEHPQSRDARLQVTLVAREPLVVTPTGIAVDRSGRVFVGLNHTHFRPDDYDGPPRDQIVILVDDDGDGRAERTRVFYEGFKNLMDIAFHPDGTLYAATRAAIYRLPDADEDGRADGVEPIVELQSEGSYPHNGISGLAFDFRGDLQFGVGENLGKSYALCGGDGRVLRQPSGAGGMTYKCRSNGSSLERVSRGWWNPFGLCTDSFGRTFGTDNDPDSSPPCRLLQVIGGADFGYEFRYGRSGLNPLITWTGLLPGTLPMASPTGEAPAGIVCYEASGLPARYFGSLLVAVWSDHRIESYHVRQEPSSGMASVERSVLVEGTGDFRPVDLAVAPDGSVYFTDWVLARYAVHGRGRVWRIARRKPDHSSSPPPVRSLDRGRREQAVRAALAGRDGIARLRQVVESDAPGAVRATALAGLDERRRAAGDDGKEITELLERVASGDRSLSLRRMAAERLGKTWRPASIAALPIPLRCVGLRNDVASVTAEEIRRGLDATDAAYFTAAVAALASDRWWDRLSRRWMAEHGAAVLLAARRRHMGGSERASWIRRGIESSDASARLAAIKWAADERVTEAAPWLEALLGRDDLAWREFRAVFVARQRLDGRKVTDWPSAEQLEKLLADTDRRLSAAARRWIVRAATYRHVPLDLKWLERSARRAAWRDEAAWAIVYHPSARRVDVLSRLAGDTSVAHSVRLIAVLGLAQFESGPQPLLVKLARSADDDLADEALRALVGMTLNDVQRRQLSEVGRDHAARREAVVRAVTGKLPAKPPAARTKAWFDLLQGVAGDAGRGERIFFHPKITACGKCHVVEGRGTRVGPSLGMIHARLRTLGSAGRRWLLETILQPSREMAPQYTPWLIQTSDGRTWTGLPLRKGGAAEAYLDAEGREFRLKKETIEAHRESTVSIMPEGLLNGLTRQEIADLLAFLQRG